MPLATNTGPRADFAPPAGRENAAIPGESGQFAEEFRTFSQDGENEEADSGDERLTDGPRSNTAPALPIWNPIWYAFPAATRAVAATDWAKSAGFGEFSTLKGGTLLAGDSFLPGTPASGDPVPVLAEAARAESGDGMAGVVPLEGASREGSELLDRPGPASEEHKVEGFDLAASEWTRNEEFPMAVDAAGQLSQLPNQPPNQSPPSVLGVDVPEGVRAPPDSVTIPRPTVARHAAAPRPESHLPAGGFEAEGLGGVDLPNRVQPVGSGDPPFELHPVSFIARVTPVDTPPVLEVPAAVEVERSKAEATPESGPRFGAMVRADSEQPDRPAPTLDASLPGESGSAGGGQETDGGAGGDRREKSQLFEPDGDRWARPPAGVEPGSAMTAPSMDVGRPVASISAERPKEGPVVAVQAPLPELPVERVSAPPRELVLTIPSGQEGDGVLASVHVRDQNGAVEIAVRTPDEQLSTSLQESLPDLVTRLEAHGAEASAARGDQAEGQGPDWGGGQDRQPEGRSDDGQSRGKPRVQREKRQAEWQSSLRLAAH